MVTGVSDDFAIWSALSVGCPRTADASLTEAAEFIANSLLTVSLLCGRIVE
jgi:hypothetical protein